MIYRCSMIGREPTNLSFQTFFISHEQSNCPLVSEIIRTGKIFEERKLLEDNLGATSIGYGKRILINGSDMDLSDLRREDILEIIDYDPVKKIVLAIGQKEPCIETPVHWLVHHARDDINAIVQITGEKILKKFSGKFPSTEKEYPSGTLELAKEVLKTLRTSKSIIIKNKGILFIGATLKEIEELVLKTCEESK